jgi:hypothetical protein
MMPAQESLKTSESVSLLSRSSQEVYTACLGVEGNGANFAVHLGVYIALLEHNILPTVAIGGSSGAVTISLLMALVENQLLDQIDVNLTKPQKAALVLAACSSVLESFTFFPTLTQPKKILWNWAQNFFVHHYRDRLLAEADTEVIHVENMVGQVAVAVDFFRNTDFSAVVQENDYLKRCQLVKQLWLKYTDAIEITTRELIKALNHYDKTNCSSRDKVVVDRLVKLLYREDTQSEQSIVKQVLLQSKAIVTQVYRLIKQRSLRSRSGLVEQILQRKIALFNPEYVWMGYRGFSKTGAFLHMPKGTVIHSAFRKACALHAREYSGWQNLYQAYFPAADVLPHFLVTHSQLAAQIGDNLTHAEPKSMVPPDRILILPEATEHTKRGFSYALQASISETGYFYRYPLPVTEHDRPLNPTMPQMLLPFGGGWLERTPVASIKPLPICQDVDFCITLCRQESVPWFSRLALRTVLGDQGAQSDQEFFHLTQLMDSCVNHATSLTGRKGSIHAVFDKEWNNPIVQGNENFFLKDVKVTLLPDRQAHMLIGYLEVVKILRCQGYYATPNPDLLPWGKPVPASLTQEGKSASRTAPKAFWQFLSSLRIRPLPTL